jgi:hypothetical protein
MTEPQETEENDERTDPIVAPPTANPTRVRVPPEGLGGDTDKGHPASPGSRPEEEA